MPIHYIILASCFITAQQNHNHCKITWGGHSGDGMIAFFPCVIQTDLAWTGMGLDVSCNCTDCMNGTLSDPNTVLEGRAVCLRNIYVVILAALGGIILTCIVFTIYILVQGKTMINDDIDIPA